MTYNAEANKISDTMAKSFDLLIRYAVCVSHRGTARADVGVLDGRTAAIGALVRFNDTLDTDG